MERPQLEPSTDLEINPIFNLKSDDFLGLARECTIKSVNSTKGGLAVENDLQRVQQSQVVHLPMGLIYASQQTTEQLADLVYL